MLRVVLTASEIQMLDRQNPSSERNGGWQGLIVRLQRSLNRATGEIVLEARDVARIGRYALAYGNGGWESRLRAIFGRTLGPNLGNQAND